MVMDRKEWINRCARRLRKLVGLEWNKALSEAGYLANQQAEENGESGLAWQSPEDAADDFQESHGKD